MKKMGTMAVNNFRTVCRLGILSLMLIQGAHVKAAPPSSATVSGGDFIPYGVGLDRYPKLSGHATMVRVPSGKTIVTTTVRGLYPNTEYGSHVHNKPCDTDNGGGHYQHEVGGEVDAINEIWPLLTTSGGGVGSGYAKNDFIAREDAQSIVVHDTDSARVACADLN